MRFLFVIRTIQRDYGGPLEGTREIASELTRLGHHAEVAHLDAEGTRAEAYFDVPLHAFGPSFGGYGYSPRLVPWMRAHAGDYDAVIVNGLWHYPGAGVERALRGSSTPYYVYTHGSLHPWFQRFSRLKEWERRLYWKFAESRVMAGARAVLFTSEEERNLARRSYAPFPEDLRVASFCSGEPPANLDRLARRFREGLPALRERRVVLFLGRIHPVKGCDLLLEAFASLAGAHPDLCLVMAGPDPANMAGGLAARAKRFGIQDRVFFPGALYENDKWGAFAAADLFVSPSHAECFGVSLVAAMAAGTPVAVTNRVNIWRQIVADGAGFAADATAAGIGEMMSRWLVTPERVIAAMKVSARDSFRKRYTPHKAAVSLLEALEEPACVRPHG